MRHPNFLATILELTIPLLLAWLLITSKMWGRFLLILATLTVMSALVLTLSRGGIIASVASFIAMALLASMQRQWRFVAVGGTAIATIVGVIGTVLLLQPELYVKVVSERGDDMWYQATYDAPAQLEAEPGTTLEVPLTLTNNGIRDWIVTGGTPIKIAYHLIWIPEEDTDISTDEPIYALFDSPRTFLPHQVAPGEQTEVVVPIEVPNEPGSYVIEWDMVREYVAWFSDKGTPTARTELRVLGTPSAVSPWIVETSETAPVTVNEPSRSKLWRLSLEMAADNPLFGIGLRNFSENYRLYTGEDQGVPHAHSIYFGWLAETGIIGLLAFLWLSIVLAWRLFWDGQRLITEDKTRWIIWLFLVTSLIAWYVHGLVDFPFWNTSAQFAFWFIVGLALRVSLPLLPNDLNPQSPKA